MTLKRFEDCEFYERVEVVHEVAESRRSRISFSLMVSLLAERTRDDSEKRILDLGCGDGSFVLRFKGYCHAFGVDVSSKAVELAKKAGLDAYRIDASRERLPFADNYFDVVYMGDIIEHLINPDFAIQEVVRVMGPDGFLVISTPNLASWLNRLLLLFGFQPLSSEVSTVRDFGRPVQRGAGCCPVGHIRLFTFRALKEFLAYYRLRVIVTKAAPIEMNYKLLGIVDRMLSELPPLASIIVMVAQKNL